MSSCNNLPYYPLYLGGEWSDGCGKMDSHNPATAQPWAQFALAGNKEVEQAIAAAKQAQNTAAWRDMTATARGKLLYKLADLIEQHADELGRIETADSGKLATETRQQTRYVADYYRYYAGLADKIEGATLPIDKPQMQVYTVREPIGVVLAVVPWNAQMFLAATKLAPALAAGCSVILKASEIAPCAMLYFARLLAEVGFPAGVVSVLCGDVENCAAPLAAHPDIDRLAFTGGTEAAQHIVRHTANNFAVTSLELGGKSPLLIFADADLESAANGLIAGNFGASGQSCVAASRALVQRSVLPALIENIRQKSANIIVGDPQQAETQMGPLCTQAQIERIEQTLAAAKQQQATIHFGGARVTLPPPLAAGNFFQPTLVECHSADTATLQVEMFGPVMSLLAFDSEEEAIALANNTQYGLGSGIFTKDVARAHRVSRLIRAGICWINTYRAISPIAPFGGYNQSGYGREAGAEAVLEYTRTKTIWLNLSDTPMANPFVMR
ncbi:MAG: aldehyde dehydrogenase [Proteobacteria bacterium]|nr:aldehyde dehydrogenase [Pseudomonadota bacterium]